MRSIGTLAAALAKAQIELVQPRKVDDRHDPVRRQEAAAEQIFRYAPLSSGLEIVRKTLGQHEIATVQTTAIDQAAGVVKLTTTVLPFQRRMDGLDLAGLPSRARRRAPKRMGAALTYARRYALFTLAGIAGEDDLDAPDLNAPEPAAEVRNTKQPSNGQTRPNGRHKIWRAKDLADREGKLNSTSANPALKQRAISRSAGPATKSTQRH